MRLMREAEFRDRQDRIVPLLSNAYFGLGDHFSRELPTSVKKARHDALAFNMG